MDGQGLLELNLASSPISVVQTFTYASNHFTGVTFCKSDPTKVFALLYNDMLQLNLNLAAAAGSQLTLVSTNFAYSISSSYYGYGNVIVSDDCSTVVCFLKNNILTIYSSPTSVFYPYYSSLGGSSGLTGGSFLNNNY